MQIYFLMLNEFMNDVKIFEFTKKTKMCIKEVHYFAVFILISRVFHLVIITYCLIAGY